MAVIEFSIELSYAVASKSKYNLSNNGISSMCAVPVVSKIGVSNRKGMTLTSRCSMKIIFCGNNGASDASLSRHKLMQNSVIKIIIISK